MTAFKIEINDRPVLDALNRLAAAGRDLTPAMRAISMALLSQTEANFAAQSGPTGPWPALKKSTIKGRERQGTWPGKILQVRAGGLAASVTPFASATEAGVGTNKVYAAIHQLGGDIERAAYSSWVRLRTGRGGALQRQEGHPNLAVFAKDKHKRAKTVSYTTGPYTIHIPARPFLPVDRAGNLAPQASLAVLDIIQEYLQATWKG